MSVEITICSEPFILHPSGAVFWKTHDFLLVADVHLGKVTHFRRHGAAIPAQVAHQNLEKLTEVVHHFQPKKIIFLGDLFHSHWNDEWYDFEKWTAYIKTEIILIEGNHDIIPKTYYDTIGVKVLESFTLDSFFLTHHPTEKEGFFNFSGHIHPGVLLRGLGKQHLRLSCFFKTSAGMILPAFGTFTGKHILKPSASDEVYALADGEVICISPQEPK